MRDSTAYGYAFDVTRKEELNLAISRIENEVRTCGYPCK